MFSIYNDYPKLWDLLVAWFSDFDESDEEIINGYLRVSSQEEVDVLLDEIERCLNAFPFPGIEIGHEANRRFYDDEEVKEWITKIKDLIQKRRDNV